MTNFTWKPRRSILALAILSATGAVFAEGQTHHINIAPQSVSDALKALAAETHIQIFSDGEALKGKKTNGIQGDFSAKEALQKLLTGTGLTYTFTSDDAVAVKAVELGSEASTLPVVEVTGKAQLSPTDPYNTDYNRTESSTATKTDTPIMKTPMSVKVVPQQVLKDQQAVSMEQALRNVREPLKNCRFAQQSFKKSGRKFQYLAIFSSKQPVFLEN
jgi:iron complex outermembrane receptor protein